MKNLILLFTILFVASSGLMANDKDKKNKDEDSYKIKDEVVIPHTGIRNQYRSGTCWSFSGLALFEAELMRLGKGKHDLSDMFIVHHTYYEKSLKYVRMHGTINFGGGGAFNDVSHVIDKYGLITEDAYRGIQYDKEKHVHSEMDNLLKAMVNAIIENKNKELTPVWHEAIKGTLNAYLGEIPETFEYEGKEYTPKEFSNDFMELDMDDYPMFTSYTHQPFYDDFVLEVQDNWAWGEVNNVPLNDMMSIIDNALNNGYTIAWAADVSEKGFSWTDGLAIVPETDIENLSGLEKDKWEKKSKKEQMAELYKFDKPRKEKTITQELRQKAFDNYQTTDDHGMLIVGIAKDQNGTKYYKIKNSWGTDQKYEGYFYASEAYVKYKTMSIMLHEGAVPDKIVDKFDGDLD